MSRIPVEPIVAKHNIKCVAHGHTSNRLFKLTTSKVQLSRAKLYQLCSSISHVHKCRSSSGLDKLRVSGTDKGRRGSSINQEAKLLQLPLPAALPRPLCNHSEQHGEM